MKIVVAPDSFKGSLTAKEAAEQMKSAITEIMPEANVLLKPMADGGEGTLDSLTTATHSAKICLHLTGPLGTTISTTYRILPDKTAIIETATIAGLPLVPEQKQNPDDTTSYGIGEAMLDAMDKGCDTLVIGLGGSATNDGGLGMLQALGMNAFDEHSQSVDIYGKDVCNIAHIDLSGLDKRLPKTTILIASDVANPLCGESGASTVYGPQKGATPHQVWQYDAALDRYSGLVEGELGKSFKNIEGAGAAGGLGFAFLAIGAELSSGAMLIAETTGLPKAISSADLVITGEGQSDEQTLYGKAPGYIASIANQHNVPVLLLSGSISDGENELRQRFSGCFSIINAPMSLESCIDNAGALLLEQTKQMMHFLSHISRRNS